MSSASQGAAAIVGAVGAGVAVILAELVATTIVATVIVVATVGVVAAMDVTNVVIIVLVKPSRMAGFLPYRSENLPQGMPNTACVRLKTAAQMPAHFPTSF